MPKYKTDHQNALHDALLEFNDAMQTKWANVVEVVNQMCVDIENQTESYDSCFPPDLERMMDNGAMKTAWIYGRLECAGKSRRDTRTKIRKAMGYNYRG